MRKLILGLLIVMLFMLAACGQPTPTPKRLAHVQCLYDEEVVFDQQFDRAEALDTGQVRVWIGADSADLDATCRIVP